MKTEPKPLFCKCCNRNLGVINVGKISKHANLICDDCLESVENKIEYLTRQLDYVRGASKNAYHYYGD